MSVHILFTVGAISPSHGVEFVMLRYKHIFPQFVLYHHGGVLSGFYAIFSLRVQWRDCIYTHNTIWQQGCDLVGFLSKGQQNDNVVNDVDKKQREFDERVDINMKSRGLDTINDDLCRMGVRNVVAQMVSLQNLMHEKNMKVSEADLIKVTRQNALIEQNYVIIRLLDEILNKLD